MMNTTPISKAKKFDALQQIEDRLVADMDRLKRMRADLDEQFTSTLRGHLEIYEACVSSFSFS